MDIKEYEQLQPNVVYQSGTHKITFLTPNAHCAWRVETLNTKEPDTIAWLAKMQTGETLFDVGSNMGQYALIAAKNGVKVHAFEPESQNFALLCRNIGVNTAFDLVTPWPLALSDRSSIDFFYSQSLLVGGSCSSYGESVNYHLQPRTYPIKQGSMSVTLDAFADQYGYPHHIKLDVDGLEHKVLAGAKLALKNCESVLVELNSSLPEHTAIYDLMKKSDLKPDMLTAAQAQRKEGPFKGIGNVIFYKA